MHTLFILITSIFMALKSLCATLNSQFEQLTGHPFGLFGVAAVVVTSLVLAVGCGVWAIIERARRGNYRERVQAVLRRSQIARHFRDSILESLPEAVVVLRSKSQQALSYSGGSALLQQCLNGPDAIPLAVAINDLLKRASGFSLSVRTSKRRQIFVRGCRIGHGAALFLRTQGHYDAKEAIGTGEPEIVPHPIATSLDGEPSTASTESAGSVRPFRVWRLKDGATRATFLDAKHPAKLPHHMIAGAA